MRPTLRWFALLVLSILLIGLVIGGVLRLTQERSGSGTKFTLTWSQGCSDYNIGPASCASVKPKYCPPGSDGTSTTIDNCQECGCPKDYRCLSTGQCQLCDNPCSPDPCGKCESCTIVDRCAGTYSCDTIDDCCGNGKCESGEDACSCSADCSGKCEYCGDGSCNGKEDCSSCPKDCGSCGGKCKRDKGGKYCASDKTSGGCKNDKDCDIS